jgi:hypothetical protein
MQQQAAGVLLDTTLQCMYRKCMHVQSIEHSVLVLIYLGI